jgi:hypothetical protein
MYASINQYTGNVSPGTALFNGGATDSSETSHQISSERCYYLAYSNRTTKTIERVDLYKCVKLIKKQRNVKDTNLRERFRVVDRVSKL